MNLGEFGKRTILWGAGLSKTWGGFLADEFWGHLQGRTGLDSYPRLRELLAAEGSFERALDRASSDALSLEERRALWHAVHEVFELQDQHLLDTLKPPAPPVNEARFLQFLSGFRRDWSTASTGYLFTLNQDILLEAMGSYRAGAAAPLCPAVFPSQRAFTGQFRSPFLVEAEREIRPVPAREPEGGWPVLPGGLHYVKLHGSALWKTAAGNYELVIGGDKTGLIDRSPLLSWYRDIFRAVCTDGHVRMLIIGYGFRDEHINSVLAEGVADHHLALYVVGHGSHDDFRRRLDARLLPGLRGYVNTPIGDIVGTGPPDTAAMIEIKRFLGP